MAYLEFCTTEGISTKPTIETITRFISVSVRRPSIRTGRPLSPRSVACYLSGIASSLLPQWPFVKSVTDHPIVRKTLRGAMKTLSKPVSRKDPISLEDIEIVASGSGNSLDERLFLTILSIGFHGLHRLGELTIPDSSSLTENRKSILRHTLKFSRCGRYAKYTLPYHKGDPYFLGSEVLLASCDLPGVCPVAALKAYLPMRDTQFPQLPYLLVTSKGKRPTRSWFLQRFHEFFDHNKSGHSLRSGGATALGQAGMPMEFIQIAGRWSSEAFRIYVRDHPLLMLGARREHPLALANHAGAFVAF